ncbi:MAG: DUF6600 domain-containing protein [Pyrinomonadaceae bacterium]
MFTGSRPLFTLAFLLLFALAFGVPTLRAASFAQTINIPDKGTVDDDEEAPDVTDRVARVSFVEGSAKIRRADSQDWEAITLNLPLVEGDEIATDGSSRLELQLGKDQHVRIAENSSITVVTLRDDGIALSLTVGTATAHLGSFDKGKSFFEIDAPKTTVAIEKAGIYRIDAGRADSDEVRVAATDGGEAHVYSDSAGFTLKNGRSTRIAIAGANAGEWQSGDATAATDEFDAWSAGRDLIVAEKLRSAHYSTYYDDDIYGADDLDTYGDWVHTSQYGWVWRPSNSAISAYANWSPYRYGRWEWMPPFGWIWVNDEPWGWATYHHGRWVFDNGYWAWAPYPYYRQHRSWWLPALVTINIIDNQVCWYPTSYHEHHRWDYWGHGHGHDHDRGRDPGRQPVAKTNPKFLGPPVRDGGPTRERGKHPPIGVPPGAVVGVTTDDFAKGGRGIRPMPPEVASIAFEREPKTGELVALGNGIKHKVPPAFRAEPPSREAQIENRRSELGAGTRTSGVQLDQELQKTKMFGGRTPRPVQRELPPPNGEKPRPTGAVERENGVHHERDGSPVRENSDGREKNIRPMPPVRDGGPVKTDEPRPQPKPKVEPRPAPKSDPRPEPRPQPNPRPHSEPPTRSEPKPQPAPRSEPKSEPKASPPARSDGDHHAKAKDG